MLKRSFGTHSGSFHADEVTACALLLLFDLIDPDKIVRSRDQMILDQCEYVCDVGGVYDSKIKRFDHHQVEYQGPLSSAGMILLYLKETSIIDAKLHRYFYSNLVLGIDLHDNGKIELETNVCTFSNVISNFLPIDYDATTEDFDNAFYIALDFSLGHLRRFKARYEYALQCKDIVEQEMKKNGICLYFECSIPWLDSFFALGGESHPAKFVLMPSHGHWKLRGVPPNLKERMKVRHPLPKVWSGLQHKDLEKVSGIKGAVFCHKGQFISIWETKEAAEKALEWVLKKG